MLQRLSQRPTRVTRRSLRVALDGEVVLMNAPLHYQILPLALRVIVR